MPTPNFADKTIWTGDNLDILRGMNSECADLIYLDPPFNSNQDYAAPVGSAAAGAAFKDTWTLSDLDVAWLGLVADEQPTTAHVVKTAGMTHGKRMQSYLTMMAVRLMEMHRVLKPTGSIYLHCDTFACHYLKLLMDAIFGASNFRNEIVWRRTHAAKAGSRNPRQRAFGTISDSLLLYANGESARVSIPKYYPDGYEDEFKYADERGKYRIHRLVASAGMHKSPTYEWRGLNPEYGWLYNEEGMNRLYSEGRIHFNSAGTPSRKEYVDEYQGRPIANLWTDVPIALGKERTGYPTQKPMALLERIIKASSEEGDVVLDPFCGCATACVAADRLGRQWVGIDISPKAVELVNMRLQQAMGSLFHHGYVTARTDIPRRTDIDAPIPYRRNKHVLFGQQEGVCNGCRTEFPFRILEVDHVIPQSRGGTDHLDNLQLLCSSCNRIKGDRPQEYLMARLAELGV